MRVQKCKGTRDLSPEEMLRFRLIEGVFRDDCLKWGYQEVRTPTIEYLHLFTSTGTLTPGTLSKVYSFLDWDGWSGERVVLRPDGTIPIARMYIDNLSEQSLARLFYVTNIFIFEGTGKESRERWQCGAELIGAADITADVELITIALESLRKLGLDNITVKLSHAGLIRALLAGFGLSPEEQGKVFDQILDGDVAVLSRLKNRTPELVRILTPLLDLKGKSPAFLRNLKAVFNHNLPQFTEALDNFIGITDLLTAMGQKYRIDIGSGRGFEYYTGLIFQLFVGDVKAGGGGRYDALIPLMGGKDIPASGFALYLDPIMGLIKQESEQSERASVLVRVQGKTLPARSTAFETIRLLHEAGLTASLDPGNENICNYRWLLDIRSRSPRFVLSDQKRNRKSEVGTLGEVVKLVGGKGVR
jgi:histidyl-tRNA synthetase